MSEPGLVLARYWIVLANEATGELTVEEFQSRSDLVLRLRRLVGKGYRVFVFSGRRLGISKAPYRHLLDGTEHIPLFEVRVSPSEDDTGSLDEAEANREEDPVYRAITRKGLDEAAKANQAWQAQQQPAPPAPASFDEMAATDD